MTMNTGTLYLGAARIGCVGASEALIDPSPTDFVNLRTGVSRDIQEFASADPKALWLGVRSASPDVLRQIDPEEKRKIVQGIFDPSSFVTNERLRSAVWRAYITATPNPSRKSGELPPEVRWVLLHKVRAFLTALRDLYPRYFREATQRLSERDRRDLAWTGFPYERFTGDPRWTNAVIHAALWSMQNKWDSVREIFRPTYSADYPDLRPVTWVNAGERTFYFSRVYRVAVGDQEPRLMAVALEAVSNTPVLELRPFYKSISNGTWRAPGWISALGLDKGPHYTAVKPAREVIETLHGLEQDDVVDISQFWIEPFITHDSGFNHRDEAAQRRLGRGLREETLVDHPSALEAHRQHFQYQGALGEIAELSYPDGFIPDFRAQPRAAFQDKHPFLGVYTVREFAGGRLEGRDVIWSMAETEQGHVWIHSLRYADARVNSFGVYSPVIDGGILNSKPIDYIGREVPRNLVHALASSVQAHHRATGRSRPFFFGVSPWSRPEESEYRYVDVTPLLALLKPIQLYAEARGIDLIRLDLGLLA